VVDPLVELNSKKLNSKIQLNPCRRNAFVALRNNEYSRAVESLIAALKDLDANVRRNAYMSGFGPINATAALSTATTNPGVPGGISANNRRGQAP
jgi:hypothetical protein